MDLIIRDGVSAALDAIGAKRKNKQVAEAMGLAIVSLTIRAFNDPSVRAAPWAPLAPATLAEKIRAGKSTAILKRSTLLFRSWRVIEATGDFVRIGSDRFYAAFQQFGTGRGVPARPMLPLLGGPTDPQLAPFALTRMVSAAKAALQGFLSGLGGNPPAQ